MSEVISEHSVIENGAKRMCLLCDEKNYGAVVRLYSGIPVKYRCRILFHPLGEPFLCCPFEKFIRKRWFEGIKYIFANELII